MGGDEDPEDPGEVGSGVAGGVESESFFSRRGRNALLVLKFKQYSIIFVIHTAQCNVLFRFLRN